jgi:hypothetical protein
MRKGFRIFLLFVPPALLAILNLGHPIVAPPVSATVLPHLQWWLRLHVFNLILFAMLGLAAYLLIRDTHNFAACISKVAIAVFVPLYAAFDGLAGIGTGILVGYSRQLPLEQGGIANQIIDAYWSSPAIYAIAATASIAWVIAMTSAAVAFTFPKQRRLAAITGVVIFVIGGWARTDIFLAADGGTIRAAWWLVTLGMAAIMFVVCRPRALAALLLLAGAFSGAAHTPPTGPVGVACFICAAAYIEMAKRKRPEFEGVQDMHDKPAVT